jgi:DNA mismatch repair protein MSH5
MGLLQDCENGIIALRMAIRVPDTAEELAEPLFRLELGVANSSAGLICAKMAGVKQAVIDRAHEIVNATREGSRVQPLIEIWRSHFSLSRTAREVFHQFLRTDWKGVSVNDVDHLLSSARHM